MAINRMRHAGRNQFWCPTLLLLLFPAILLAQDAAEIYKRSKDSVVLIEGQHHIGSGVIVPGGCPLPTSCSVAWVVTNYHVISGETSVTAKFANGNELTTSEVVASDFESDLAILKFTGGPFATAEIGDSDSLTVGQRIIVISNPMGLQGTVTEGLVSAGRQIRGRTMLQISAPISPGSSGGPVFDQSGKVIGIAAASMEGGQNLNMAIPISAIRPLLRSPESAKLADLARPQDHSPSDTVRVLQRADTYLAKEMFEEAEAQLRGGIQQYEFEPLLRLELAKLLIRTGRREDALQQLRITTKLAPEQWLPMALMGHLYIKRWLDGANLSDRRAAFQIYRSLLENRELPPVKHQLLDGVLARMRSPEGEWATGDGQRSYSVTAKHDGGFLMGLPAEDFKRLWSQPAAQMLQNAPSYLAFARYDAEFQQADGPGKFIGASSYIDAACGYKQSLKIDINDDGSVMDFRGTITQVTGIQRYLADAMGKKRVQKMCKNPGTEGLTLTLYRLRKKESFFETDVMLNADTQPLTFVAR